jgi:hypothetical protein
MYIPPPSVPRDVGRNSGGRGGGAQSEAEHTRAPRTPRTPAGLCHFFLTSVCHYGANCRNRHEGEPPLPPAGPQQSPRKGRQVFTPTKKARPSGR